MEKTDSFPKRERITSLKLIDELFGGGRSKSFAAFPLRLVWFVRERGEGDAPVQVLVSVPKKRLHHAVDRNRTKRQIRESYRLQKQLLVSAVPADKIVAMAFVWQSNDVEATDLVMSRVGKLLSRIAESLLSATE